MENHGLSKEILYKEFMKSIDKLFKDDVPGLKWYYAIWLQQFCFEKEYFAVEKVISTIVLGDEDDEAGFYYEI